MSALALRSIRDRTLLYVSPSCDAATIRQIIMRHPELDSPEGRSAASCCRDSIKLENVGMPQAAKMAALRGLRYLVCLDPDMLADAGF